MHWANEIINNTRNMRFETEVNGEFAYIEYRYNNGALALMHTFVPDFARGTGVSSALAKFALEYVKEHHIKLKVYCPFVAKYIKLHPEYELLLNKE